ncbi:hypothetical protein Pelo_18209 [Pelomyxa schiedti]|nr:hypothetical protein Pelo_18209 [Pelomyxa schiedti]
MKADNKGTTTPVCSSAGGSGMDAKRVAEIQQKINHIKQQEQLCSDAIAHTEELLAQMRAERNEVSETVIRLQTLRRKPASTRNQPMGMGRNTVTPARAATNLSNGSQPTHTKVKHRQD